MTIVLAVGKNERNEKRAKGKMVMITKSRVLFLTFIGNICFSKGIAKRKPYNYVSNKIEYNKCDKNMTSL